MALMNIIKRLILSPEYEEHQRLRQEAAATSNGVKEQHERLIAKLEELRKEADPMEEFLHKLAEARLNGWRMQ